MAWSVATATTCSPAGRVLTASVAVPARTWRPTSSRHRATPATARSPSHRERARRAGAVARRSAGDRDRTAWGRPRPGCRDRLGGGSCRTKAGTRARWLRSGAAPCGPREGGGMPPEQDDLNRQLEAPQQQENLNRQLEALQRYVSGLQQQRERPKAEAAQPSPAPEPEPRRPSRRWLLLTGLLVTVALVGGVFVGAVAWSTDQPAGAKAGVAGVSSATQSPDTTRVAPVAAPACKTAVDRANTMLAVAVELRRELAEYSRIMSDPSTRNLSGREVVEKTAASLQAGASELASFERALANYRQVVDQCKLRTP